MNQENLHHPPIVPIEYAGKWIAWDRNLTKPSFLPRLPRRMYLAIRLRE